MRGNRTLQLAILRVISGVGGERLCWGLIAFGGGVAGRSMVRSCRVECDEAEKVAIVFYEVLAALMTRLSGHEVTVLYNAHNLQMSHRNSYTIHT